MMMLNGRHNIGCLRRPSDGYFPNLRSAGLKDSARSVGTGVFLESE